MTEISRFMNYEARKEFEKWATDNGMSVRLSDGEHRPDGNAYAEDSTYWAYHGWCAKALQSVDS
jgi:hypothetical protein